MGVHIKESRVTIRELKTFHFNFDLPENVDKNLKHNQ